LRDYYTCSDRVLCSKIEDAIDKKFAGFRGYLEDLLSRRAAMIKTVFGFYYDKISSMNTDMQHGLTRSESPDVIDFLRETSSGSQTEVPKILSLPDRELVYLKGLKKVVEAQMAREEDEEEKARLNAELDKITGSIKTIEENIKIVNILEEVGSK
ncbi:MAG: hypothetical protein WDA72_12420, partial [Desulfomonilia bacterium]